MSSTGAIRRLAFLHSASVGGGGLGMCAATSLGDLADQAFAIHAYGPGLGAWPLATPVPEVAWHPITPHIPSWIGRYTHRRWMMGRHLCLVGRALGRMARDAIAKDGADGCYAFSGVALETLQWLRRQRIAAMLECATGHIRDFYDLNLREHHLWCRGPYVGHPSLAMVEREEEEYDLASHIRVSSTWAVASFRRYGVSPDKLRLVTQTLNTERFAPRPAPLPDVGPLRLCFVGDVTLRKGFPYLLQAMQRLGARATSLEIAGSTGTRYDRQVFARLAGGLDVRMLPQDPVAVHHRSELFVFPSLQDGFGFAVAEAMACGLPVIVTDTTGAADWVTPECGWIIPAGNTERLMSAIAAARDRRHELGEMGSKARQSVLQHIARRKDGLPLFDLSQ